MAPLFGTIRGIEERTELYIFRLGLRPRGGVGRLARRGETDYYSFRAEAGQILTFQVVSGFPQIAAAGSAATVPNFDPAITLYEPAGSWFDAKRLKRIAYNDEPVWVFGKPTDPLLVHRFTRAGEYFVRVEAFAGQGGPDYSYALKVAPGAPARPQRRLHGPGQLARPPRSGRDGVPSRGPRPRLLLVGHRDRCP